VIDLENDHIRVQGEEIIMREKIIFLEEAAHWVEHGCLLGFTSQSLENSPMAFVRELVRQGARDIRLATLTGGGLQIDLLIGAGAVSEYETCHCSLGDYGPAPNFQRALRLQTVKVKDNT
jgi:glutaconate CoA-transferase subunit A